jgi:type III secretory pathway lipoprotein EscJ
LRAFCLPYEKPDEIQTKGLVDASETLKEKSKRQRKIEIIQQLRKTIPGITCIDLTFNSPQSPLERLNPSPATASVSLQYKDSPPSFTNEQIRDLVSKAVPDLKVENVQVYSYYVPIDKNSTDKGGNSTSFTQHPQFKVFVLIGAAFLLIFIVMTFILLLRRKKSDTKDDDEEYEEEEIPLLESGDEFEDE